MRILMLSHGYPPTVSGVTLVVQKVSRALARAGHAVAVITASERGRAYTGEDEGVQLLRVHSIPNPFWREGPIPYISVNELSKTIHEFQPDLIHTHENAVLSRQLRQLNLRDGIPQVASCYYLPRYVTHYLKGSQKLEQWIQNTLWRYAIHDLDQYAHVIFSTPSQRQEYLQHGLSAPSTAISNGVDMTRYYPSNGHMEDIEVRYSLPPRPRILFVGRLAKDKKIELLIQCMSQVCMQREAHLLIVGRGDERAGLEAMTRQLGLEANIHLLGFVPEQDLPALYRASDIFAIASVCEVQSIPALQATVTGLPIVGVKAAALPELIHENVNGYLVPPDDPQGISEAILRILNNPDHALQLGQASLKIGKAHSELVTFRKFEQLYRGVILNHAPGQPHQKASADQPRPGD